MDPNATEQTAKPLAVRLQQHRFLILGGIGALLLVGVGTALLSGGQTTPQPEMTPVIPEEEPVSPTPVGPTLTPTAQQHRTAAISVVTAVHTALKNGAPQTVTNYFMYGKDYWQTEDGVLQTLRQLIANYSQNGNYDGQIMEENIEIVGRSAQVPVLHMTQEKQLTARYDLTQTPAGWRITQISYDRQPDLSEVKRLQEELTKQLDQPTYYQTPATFTLPAGDVVEVEKTLFTTLRTPAGKHEDVEVTVKLAKGNYILALYDGAYIAHSAVVQANDPGTHFHAFDIRPLLALSRGSLLFYPSGTAIDKTKPGKPDGVVYEIPIKLEVKE